MFKSLTLPLLVTLFLHGLLVVIFLVNAPQTEMVVKKAPPLYIEAKLVMVEKPKPKPKSETRAKPVVKPKPSEQAAKQREQKERQRIEQQRQQQLAAEAQARELKAQREQQAREREQQQQAERQKLLREQQQQEFAELLEQESAAREAESDAELASSYIALITRVIQSNWSRPPSARNNMEAELLLQLVPTGEVIGVRVIKSSGNAAFDRSAENAVRRAGRFPELQQLPSRVFEQSFRRLTLRFRPEDLRL